MLFFDQGLLAILLRCVLGHVTTVCCLLRFLLRAPFSVSLFIDKIGSVRQRQMAGVLRELCIVRQLLLFALAADWKMSDEKEVSRNPPRYGKLLSFRFFLTLSFCCVSRLNYSYYFQCHFSPGTFVLRQGGMQGHRCMCCAVAMTVKGTALAQAGKAQAQVHGLVSRVSKVRTTDPLHRSTPSGCHPSSGAVPAQISHCTKKLVELVKMLPNLGEVVRGEGFIDSMMRATFGTAGVQQLERTQSFEKPPSPRCTTLFHVMVT